MHLETALGQCGELCNIQRGGGVTMSILAASTSRKKPRSPALAFSTFRAAVVISVRLGVGEVTSGSNGELREVASGSYLGVEGCSGLSSS